MRALNETSMQNQDPVPPKDNFLNLQKDLPEISAYNENGETGASNEQSREKAKEDSKENSFDDAQDNYFEKRDPSELAFCIILAAIYAGLARFLWSFDRGGLDVVAYFFSTKAQIEGLFVTLALLSIMLGIRPYLSPSSLQISYRGIKYRGPYWPDRKTVNWSQIFRLYLSSDVIVVLYHPANRPQGMRFLFIQCNYLSNPKQLLEKLAKYSTVAPVYMRNPDWYLKGLFLIGYLSLVCWILSLLAAK